MLTVDVWETMLIKSVRTDDVQDNILNAGQHFNCYRTTGNYVDVQDNNYDSQENILLMCRTTFKTSFLLCMKNIPTVDVQDKNYNLQEKILLVQHDNSDLQKNSLTVDLQDNVFVQRTKTKVCRYEGQLF